MEDNKNLVQGTDVEVDVVVDAATEEPTVDSTQTAADSVVPNDANTMKERDMAKVTARQKVAKVLVQIALYLFLGLMALIVLFPFYWMIISSLKDIEEYVLAVPTMFPKEFHFENYVKAFNTASLGTLFLNTLYVGIVSTVLSLVITVLSAFAFARLEFKGKNILFAALLATMMIPGELFTITNYVTVSKFGWTETYTVLIVPFLVSVFYIYLLRQNFLQIPDELYYAAKVDGTSDLKYLWRIMIPLALPTLISITILKMMGAWNSYMWPLIVLQNENSKTMPILVSGLTARYTIDYGSMMLAVTISTIPMLIIFFVLQKNFVEGITGSVKS